MAASTHDRKGRPLVAVTGLGVVTALGQGVADNWARLTTGQSGLKRITRFPIDGLRSTVAGSVDFMGPAAYSAYGLSLDMAHASAEEAIAQAGIGSKHRFPGPLYIATPPSELEWPQLRALDGAGPPSTATDDIYRHLASVVRSRPRHEFSWLAPHVQFSAMANVLADEFGTLGVPVALCTACASGVSAVQLGLEAIRRGDTDAALCMATDATVHPEGMIRFSLLSALSTHNDPPEKASRPFAKSRNGFVIAEGAAALVLESLASARARGARVIGILRGCGEHADHYHRTRSKPDGSAIIGAMQRALDDACTQPDDIDCVNAHGTGTPENDKMEYQALKAVLGERAHVVPVSANKSIIGHTLIASGAVESVFALMSIATGTLPPTMNCDDQDPAIPLDVVPLVKREKRITTVLKNAFGFGGMNVCAVYAAEPT